MRTATDMLYYIMDYNGNYFRTDSKDQLVAAGNESEASVFTFVDANKRITGGKKNRFYFMTPVPDTMDQEDTEEEFPVTDALEEAVSEEPETETLADVIISAARELTEAEIPDEVEKSMSEYDLSKIDWKEYLTHFTFITAGMKEYREELVKAESDVDQKICDVLHYIELCDTSEEEAADLVELLKVCRENRRSIKDEIIRIDAFQRTIGTSANVAKAKEALKTIKGLDTRKYTPRKFTELFDGSTVKAKASGERAVRGSKAEMVETIQTEQCTEEVPSMEYIRRETPFDNKETDWLAFANQQAEFYRNANQYMMNLQMDMDDIDAQIADLLDEMENAKCNVTQGYNLFKKMQELRLARREKEKELTSLTILTEHFDLTAMADECVQDAADLDAYLNSSDEEEQAQESTDSFDKTVRIEERRDALVG